MGDQSSFVRLKEISDVTADDQERYKGIDDYVDKLLGDEERLHWVHFIAKHYSHLIDDIINDAIRLSTYDEVVYLIDFDVLRNHLEEGAASKIEQIFVDNLFYITTPKYGIPQGAFIEFLIWLKRLKQFEFELTEDSVYQKKEGLKTLAKALEIDLSSDLSDDQILSSISERIDQKAVILSRLLSIFTDPRYLGVISDYEKSEAIQIKEILSLLPRNRSDESRRRYLDDNDGINLAIVIKSIREAKKQKEEGGNSQVYYLVTQTNIILKLAERLRESFGEKEINLEPITTLQNLMGEYRHLEEIPVLHPRQVVNAEHLGAFSTDMEEVIKRFRQWRTLFNDFKETIEERVVRTKIDEIQKRVRARHEIQDTVGFLESLASVANQIVSPEHQGLYFLEELRAKSISVDYARGQQNSDQIPLHYKLAQKTIGLVKLLHEVQTLIDRTESLKYDFALKGTLNPQFTGFEVVQTLSPPSGSPILEGGLVFSRVNGNSDRPTHFETRWPTYCDNETFVNSLRSIIDHQHISEKYDKSDNGKMSLRLRHLKHEDASFWNEGLIVYSLGEVFVNSLEFLGTRNGWEQITLRNLKLQIENIQTEEKVFGNLDDLRKIEIQQYRIATRFADFVYDVVPIEPQRVRYLRVLSHYNISAHIVNLFDRTGFIYCNQSELYATLDSLFSKHFTTYRPQEFI